MVLRDDSVSFANRGYLSLVTHFILEESEESLIALVSTKLHDYFFIFFYFISHSTSLILESTTEGSISWQFCSIERNAVTKQYYFPSVLNVQ